MRSLLNSMFRAILLSLPVLAACSSSDEPSSPTSSTVPGGQSGQAGAGGAYVGGANAGGAGVGGVGGEGVGGAGAGGEAGAGGASAGSAGTSPTDPAFQAIECLQGGLAVGLKVDSFEVYGAEIAQFGDPQPPAWALLFGDGKPCSSAPDATSCLAALEEAKKQAKTSALSSTTSFGNSPSEPRELVVTTVGSEIRVAATLDELKAMLGPIDSLPKLALLARYAFANGCNIKVKQVDGGYEVWALHVLVSDCPVTHENQLFSVDAAGSMSKLASVPDGSSSGACAGRRPEGLAPTQPRQLSPLGSFFSHMAHLEAASVEAFSRLHNELFALGAPGELLDDCVTSAVDEVRHAEEMRALAERFGGVLDEPHIAPARRRSALEIALENAVEGCVRETYGALEASYQAEHAADAEVRATMAGIARDETAHAAFSWRLQAWFEDRLPEVELVRIERAMDEAVEALRGELRRPREASLVREAGLPDEATALALLGELEARLLRPGLPQAA